jgi:hypothetical protein
MWAVVTHTAYPTFLREAMIDPFLTIQHGTPINATKKKEKEKRKITGNVLPQTINIIGLKQSILQLKTHTHAHAHQHTQVLLPPTHTHTHTHTHAHAHQHSQVRLPRTHARTHTHTNTG